MVVISRLTGQLAMRSRSAVKGLEGLNGLFGEVYGNGNNMKARANIDACRTVMDNG